MRRIMSSSLLVFALATLFAFSGCSKKDAYSPTQPVGGTSENFTPHFSAKVDGKEVKMPSATYVEGGSVIVITGTDGSGEIQLFFSNNRLKLGKQQYGYKHQQDGATFGAQYQFLAADKVIKHGVTTFIRDAGSCTITRLTDKEIEGTFEFTGADEFNGEPTIRITDGKFRVNRSLPLKLSKQKNG